MEILDLSPASKSRFLCAALLLLSASVQAEPADRAAEPRDRVLGWSQDGTYLAHLPRTEELGGPDDPENDGTAQTAAIVDARTGLTQEYLLDLSGKPNQEDGARYKALPGKAAFDASWQQAHPTRCAIGRKSADGKTQAEIKIRGKNMKGRWTRGLFSFGYGSAAEDEWPESVTLALTLTRDGKTVEVATWATSSGSGGPPSGDAALCWAPGGRRVAWVVHRDRSGMRDPGFEEILIAPVGAPRIQLVPDKAVLKQAATLVGAALDKAGYALTSTKASNSPTPRLATVVYAAAGFEEAARAVAAIVPGGASVAPLDWKAPFDLVVGIGVSALKAAP